MIHITHTRLYRDILEGIFVEHFDLECERFDGDVSATARAKAMSRFKESPTCRFLLVSVQSGGVGLNIVEANHVGFVDRWFNVSVMIVSVCRESFSMM